MLEGTRIRRWSANVSDTIVVRLAQDRRQLLALASSLLSLEEQEALGLDASEEPSSLLDENAKSVADALEKRGVSIPAKIWPGAQKTVFHLEYLTLEVVQKLYAADFCDIDVEDAAGCTPLVLACWRRDWDLVEWYLDKGADTRAIEKAGFLSLPYLSAIGLNNAGLPYYGNEHQEALRRIRTTMGRMCGIRIPDDRACYCSVAGCLPAGIVIKRRSCVRHRAHDLDFYIKSATLGCVEAAYLDACRVRIFERLGMVHTCCKVERVYPVEVPYSVPRRYRLPEEERLELLDEYAELNDILEAYMRLYQDLRSECSGRFSLFWQAWWEAVSNDLPEDPPERYRFDSCCWLVSKEESKCHELAVGLGHEPDEEAIRTRIRDFLPVGFVVDPAEIFLDGISNLFDD
ncbi:hypothetical protein W97_07870 [Coniosporium apollinis CBS 100218]|uniref:Uncharacterized protein n=1 Tax=Coniosporium apollinis (strain CBS 100218) TaxID=1168221 RepID=R7Z397_CONA1|nr:uncharacterized protein W97_07870 [Coniosporium apollinis CBS 100218]EON68612.1 hypothetical protein W97_07870 [Coniosporium apollinis CBS 100218]